MASDLTLYWTLTNRYSQLDARVLEDHVAREDRTVQLELPLQGCPNSCSLKRVQPVWSRLTSMLPSDIVRNANSPIVEEVIFKR
jgi:hypothetical protein